MTGVTEEAPGLLAKVPQLAVEGRGPDELADLYLRLSLDREGKTSIERQDGESTDHASLLNLAVRKRFIDRDRSGYDKTVKRDSFEEALKALKAGEVKTLIVWKLDRLSRRGAGQVGLILDDLENSGKRIIFYKDGLDSSNPQHRLTILLLSEIARAESENISVRVKSAKAALREAGAWLGGTPPYGLRKSEGNLLEHDPETAPVVRRIVDRYFEGFSLRKIAQELNYDDVAPARGQQWTAGTIAQLLKSPTLAGLMPETVKRPDTATGGEIYTAEVRPWRHPETGNTVTICEPLITRSERHRIFELISQRTNLSFGGKKSKPRPKALLTGMIYCECGARMSKLGPSYVCNTARVGGKCSGARVYCRALDNHVVQQWARKLNEASANPRNPFLIAVAQRWSEQQDPEGAERRNELEAQIAEEEAALADLEDARYRRKEFRDAAGPQRYQRLYDEISSVLASLRAEMNERVSDSVSVGALMDVPTVLEAWDSNGDDNDTRRDLLRLGIERVTVTKAKGRGYRFNPNERVTITTVDQHGLAK